MWRQNSRGCVHSARVCMVTAVISCQLTTGFHVLPVATNFISCAEDYGLIDDDETFTCKDCT